MKQQYLAVLVVIAIVVIVTPVVYILAGSSTTPSNEPLRYTYEIVTVYPHDTGAFTEGLVFNGGFLYEGTGLNDNSTLRKTQIQDGSMLQSYYLPSEFFGEGITIFGDRIIQLTWLSHRGFVYDKQSFTLLQEFNYSTEGWGITNDGNQLIMSDGTANLYFLNPTTFEVTGHVEVHDGDRPITNLNELEYVKGSVYANIWMENRIAVIDTQTGKVKAWIDLTGLRDPQDTNPNYVLNGIAYDANADRLFVTGKCWTKLYEIKLLPMA